MSDVDIDYSTAPEDALLEEAAAEQIWREKHLSPSERAELALLESEYDELTLRATRYDEDTDMARLELALRMDKVRNRKRQGAAAWALKNKN